MPPTWGYKVHLGVSVGDQELYDQMAALNWFHSGDGCYVEKKCHQWMSDYGSTERSLGPRSLLGTLPVVQRQTAWHPNAYSKPEMRGCPKGHPETVPVETMVHFLECPVGDFI
ncbi:hypothetical protein H4R18_001944 [Coemansia javaensis]|uniref:Uncharacterized protein n=1 Tax=Coemansia javaensis TaxID=2761396 RepID=A0A9W8HFS7_9FUNG|nr:hypothetical protein H4R18_001944 [Coemansia javaensis]